MKKKRSRFWTLVFSLIPGAGEMYLGFMQNGFSIMVLFLGYVMVCALLGMEVLLFLAPALWFYSFFHVHNLARLSEEELEQLEDKSIIGAEQLQKADLGLKFNRNLMKIIGVALVIFGAKEILENVLSLIASYYNTWEMWDIYYMVNDQFMSMIIGAAIICLGVYLMRGKKVKIEQEEE